MEDYSDKSIRQQMMDYKRRLFEMQKAQSQRPKEQEWDSNLGEDGLIRENLQLKNNTNSGFLDQMRQDNLRAPGEASAWRGLMDQQITRQAGDSNAQLGAAQQRSLDNLAMRGGVSAGATERMAQAGIGQNLANQQNIFGQRLNADMADEQNRMQGLAQLGQAEMNFGNQQNTLDQLNRDATQQEIFQKRAFDTNTYNQQMSAWAAQKTAEATPSSGGGKK